MSDTIYFGSFQDRDSMLDEFMIEPNDIRGCKILLASYSIVDDDGHAFVLFEKNNVLYEVRANHNSSYGLEDQWCPDETSWGRLQKTFENGSLIKTLKEHDSSIKERLEYLIEENR